MAGNITKMIAAGFVALGTLGTPAIGSAQGFDTGGQSSVVVECGPGQRAVMEHRLVNGRTQVVGRCEGSQVRSVAYDQYGRTLQARPVGRRPLQVREYPLDNLPFSKNDMQT